MTHHLKTLPEYFQAVIDGRKPFEIRENDRDFKAGDSVILEEFKGTEVIPACADIDTCDLFFSYTYDNNCPLNRESCHSYRKEIYTGRRCLIKIKEIFKLDKIGFENYVAFTFDILNITDKKDGAE